MSTIIKSEHHRLKLHKNENKMHLRFLYNFQKIKSNCTHISKKNIHNNNEGFIIIKFILNILYSNCIIGFPNLFISLCSIGFANKNYQETNAKKSDLACVIL